VAVTIADIARRAGVTKTTVSKVLNRSRSTVRISEPTRQRIFEAVRDLNYRPSFSARCLARGRTFSIGFVCGNIHMPHYAALKTELRDQLFRELHDQADPRVLGHGHVFDEYPYAQAAQRHFHERFRRGETPAAGWVNPTDFERE